MENNVLKLEITNTSLQLRCKGMWKSTNWKIYEDLTVEIFNSYDDEKDKKYVVKLEKKMFEEILNYLEIAKQNDKEVDARDGSAWSIVQYEKGDIVWERKPDYIYGIEPLEAIANILISLKNK